MRCRVKRRHEKKSKVGKNEATPSFLPPEKKLHAAGHRLVSKQQSRGKLSPDLGGNLRTTPIVHP